MRHCNGVGSQTSGFGLAAFTNIIAHNQAISLLRFFGSDSSGVVDQDLILTRLGVRFLLENGG